MCSIDFELSPSKVIPYTRFISEWKCLPFSSCAPHLTGREKGSSYFTSLHTMFSLVIIGIIFQEIPQVYPLPLVGGVEFTSLLSSDIAVCANERTVWDIIWSCIVTIFACSWVSVHPNMPKPGEGWFKVYIRRVEVLFWAVVTPEMILFWATRQWYGAKKLTLKYEGKFS